MISSIEPRNAPLLARPYLEDDEPSPVAAVMAHVPELLEVAMPFIGAVYGPTSLPNRLKEIIVVRTSVLNQCRFCTRSHAALAAAAGLLEAEIAFLQDLAPPPATFSDPEWAAVAFADAFCRRPLSAVAPLKPLFRDDQIVELAMLAGTTIFLNRFCTAMGIE